MPLYPQQNKFGLQTNRTKTKTNKEKVFSSGKKKLNIKKIKIIYISL